MEFENVFNAAKDGKLYKLKYILYKTSESEVKTLVSALTNYATPLVAACKHGHLNVVTYLIEKCNADVEQNGCLELNNGFGPQDAAPPLWWAASAGHLDIVKALVKYMASVNSVAGKDMSSTPLLIACANGNFEIANFLIEYGADIELTGMYGNTCLMLTCYHGHSKLFKYLLECGADVNRKSTELKWLGLGTALHACAKSKSGSLEMIQMLLERGARMEMDENGITPFLTAAYEGHSQIVYYLSSKFDFTKQDKVNALELLGAAFVNNTHNMEAARGCWRQAMELRYEDNDFTLLKANDKGFLSSYIDTTEVNTLDQLNALINSEMNLQALLVTERILGPCHSNSLNFIRNLGSMYAANGDFERCIQLWLCLLDVEKCSDPLGLGYIQTTTVLFIIDMFYKISEASGVQAISFRDVINVYDSAVRIFEKRLALKRVKDLRNSMYVHQELENLMYLLSLMCRMQPFSTPNEESSLRRVAYKLVRMNLRGKNALTPLHFACSDVPRHLLILSTPAFPSLEVVDLLLKVDACPNVVDASNNTPLHIAAMNISKPHAADIFKLLLNKGAHLDFCNNENETPLQLLNESPMLNINPLHYYSLQCLCAQVIHTHQIPYSGLVSKKMCEFIDSHYRVVKSAKTERRPNYGSYLIIFCSVLFCILSAVVHYLQ